jgi:transcriptional regulator with XRE-family HTH domain
MRLDKYLTVNGIKEATFGAEIGVSQGQVNRLRRGLSMPSWETLAAIEKATKSKVTAKDFQAEARVA